MDGGSLAPDKFKIREGFSKAPATFTYSEKNKFNLNSIKLGRFINKDILQNF